MALLTRLKKLPGMFIYVIHPLGHSATLNVCHLTSSREKVPLEQTSNGLETYWRLFNQFLVSCYIWNPVQPMTVRLQVTRVYYPCRLEHPKDIGTKKTHLRIPGIR